MRISIVCFCFTIGLAFGWFASQDAYIAKEILGIVKLGYSEAYAYSYIGQQYSIKAKYRKSLKFFEKATELASGKPNSELYVEARGLAHYDCKEYQKALRDFDLAIEINPDRALTYVCRASCHIKQHSFDKAIEQYNKAISFNPKYWRPFCVAQFRQFNEIKDQEKFSLIAQLHE